MDRDETLIFILAFISFVFSFTVLYVTRRFLTGNNLSTGDTFYHLLIGESIRKNQWKYPSCLENVTFDEVEKRYNYLAYPPVFHYVIALFPIRFQLTIAKFLNLIILSCLGSLTAIAVFSILPNLSVALFAVLIVIFSLSVFELAVMFTPRPLGIIVYSMIFLISIFSPQGLISLLATTVLVSIIALTHKFAIQTLVFVLLPYSFMFNRPYLSIGFAFGLLLAILLSRGMYLKILKEHINWLLFYTGFPSEAPLMSKLRRIFTRNPWYLLVFVSAVFLFFQTNQTFLTDNLGTRIAFWAFAPIVVALIVSIRQLSFLGEDYRYVEYGIVPVGLLSSLLLSSSNNYVWFVSFFVCLTLSLITMFLYKNHLNRKKQLVEPTDIVSYRSLNNDTANNFLVLPHTRTLEVYYFSRIHVVQGVRSKNASYSEHLQQLLNKYEIRYIIKFKESDQNELFAALPSTIRAKRISTCTNFELYELSPADLA